MTNPIAALGALIGMARYSAAAVMALTCISAGAQVVVANPTADRGQALGLRLGQFLDLPACDYDKYLGYSAKPGGGCSETPEAVGASAAAFTGTASLRYWALVLPVYVAGNLEVELIGGKIESIRVPTRGLMSLVLVNADLLKKLGQPHLITPMTMKSAYRDVEAPVSTWQFENYAVTHVSAAGRIDAGLITFASPAGAAAARASLQRKLDAAGSKVPL